MSHDRRGAWRKGRDTVFAGIVGAFASAVERVRGRRRRATEINYTEGTFNWEDDPDGGLTASRVPRRPPDSSGSAGAAAVPDEDCPSDIPRR